ncbi:MAG: metallophosphoesterase, partial [Myxococcaceae bacterium]
GLGADLVAITGDLVDGDVPTLGPAVAELRRLTPKYGTWFCTGNHDYYSGVDEWTAALPGLGATPLRNRFVTIGDAGGSFDLIGVDDWMARHSGGYDLEASVRGRDPSRPSVLLAHQPQNFEAAVDRGVGLMLSGHTHGGQFFPGTLFVDRLWRYPAGLFAVRDSHIFVSQGTGFWGPPLRVGTHSEIVRVTLLS